MISSLTKEATYHFNYKEGSQTLDVYVDPIENRRYVSSDGATFTPLNYKGTGADYQEFTPSIVLESPPVDTPPNRYEQVTLLFYLEDVDAYVKGFYRKEVDLDAYVYVLDVQFLDKLS